MKGTGAVRQLGREPARLSSSLWRPCSSGIRAVPQDRKPGILILATGGTTVSAAIVAIFEINADDGS